MIYTGNIETALGTMTGAVEDDALAGLWFIGQRHYPSRRAHWVYKADHPVLDALRGYLDSYFKGMAGLPDIRLAPQGSPFRKAVWDTLLKIPRGQVATYGQIARYLAGAQPAQAVSARAVGGAVGNNPISILIPCHRVVGSKGRLTGYAGGLDRKAALLRIEEADLAKTCSLIPGCVQD